ncbi:ABC transporter substrate-binding protein [Corynebacterium macginleyi]|nr:ABC transporter substrate-binding protein [Corynebacterium macginleyi]MBK4149782.1 ABC transporter substrate-binding protein [Corynebacterium macginleyi]MBK4162210.1 ABC transporter substrate-binding protein [Corynebacterium macginleyi]MBK4180200.1 ABC transporter substrate-binding protein [Corynebacterium macginleyi]MBK4181522.1 ABC transporter substrate-binding protein [Corynebacterium macginleyi]
MSDGQGFCEQRSKEAEEQDLAKLWENAEPKIENVVNYAPDTIKLSLENIQKGLLGKFWIVIAAADKNKEFIKEDPAFNSTEAYKSDQVYYTPASTFRLDCYSAQIFLDSIKDSFTK